MKRFFMLSMLLLSLTISKAEKRTFLREYSYQASENDSKVSARQKAMTEVKRLLVEELGVYIESYVNYTVEEKNSKISNDFLTNEIRQISAGIAETKIIEEQWNGELYYVKAEITADPTEVIRLVNKTIEQRKSDVVIDSLRLLLSDSQNSLDAKNKQVNELSNTLKNKELEVAEQQSKLEKMNKQLDELSKQLEQYKKDETIVKSEIEKIRAELNNKANTALENAKIGMTSQEVKRLCGNPRSTDGYESLGDISYNYGYVWLIFNDGILRYAVKAEDYDGPQVYHYQNHHIKNLITR
ncbi:MAG: hypothetical protein J6U13_10775 [Salinivirgaceae bacterium]|nr:hypothetical protein [Salinivirgaceae bacterium]